MQPHPEQSHRRSGPAAGSYGTGAQIVALAVFLGASALVAWLGAFATVNNVNGWYASADKAPWTPANEVFGPVWTALYITMAVAAWLAFAIILALIVAVTFTVLRFGPISQAAGLLLLPYVTWIVFAASLNLWAALNN